MDIKNLVESIISDIADSKIKIGDLLRKTRIPNNEVTEILSEIKAEMGAKKNPKKLKLLFNAIIGVATEVAGNLITPYAHEAVALLSSISLPL